MTLGTSLAATVETALNAWLRQDARSRARLPELVGRIIEIRATGTGLSLFFFPDARGVAVQSSFEGEADAVIAGTPLALAGSLGGRTEDRLFRGELRIEGDTDAAQRFQTLVGDVEFDWEEHLSRVTGDVVAHQFGELTRAAGRFLRHGGATLREDVGEYLQEEARVLPSRAEIAHFMEDVDRLRSDVDRLAARVARLRKHDGASG